MLVKILPYTYEYFMSLLKLLITMSWVNTNVLNVALELLALSQKKNV